MASAVRAGRGERNVSQASSSPDKNGSDRWEWIDPRSQTFRSIFRETADEAALRQWSPEVTVKAAIASLRTESRRYLTSGISQPADVDDILSELILRVGQERAFARPNPDRGDGSGLRRTVVRRRVVKEARRHLRRNKASPLEDLGVEDSGTEAVDYADERIKLNKQIEHWMPSLNTKWVAAIKKWLEIEQGIHGIEARLAPKEKTYRSRGIAALRQKVRESGLSL